MGLSYDEFDSFCYENDREALNRHLMSASDADVGDVIFVNQVYALVLRIEDVNEAPTVKPEYKAQALHTTNGVRYRSAGLKESKP